MEMLAINWGNVGIVTLVGFGLVFVVLVLLIFILQIFGKIMAPKAKVRKGAEVATTSAQPVTPESESDYIPALDSAAIATALHLYFNEVHDEESLVVTIKTVERRYSPWNSKIYGLNNNFTR